MSELERINKERDGLVKMLQNSCPHKEAKIIDVKFGEDEEGHYDMDEGLMCTFCGKILKRIDSDYPHVCLHNFENIGFIYRCRECGKMIDITEKSARRRKRHEGTYQRTGIKNL